MHEPCGSQVGLRNRGVGSWAGGARGGHISYGLWCPGPLTPVGAVLEGLDPPSGQVYPSWAREPAPCSRPHMRVLCCPSLGCPAGGARPGDTVPQPHEALLAASRQADAGVWAGAPGGKCPSVSFCCFLLCCPCPAERTRVRSSGRPWEGGREGTSQGGQPWRPGVPESQPTASGPAGQLRADSCPFPAESDSLGLRTQAVLWFGLGPTAPGARLRGAQPRACAQRGCVPALKQLAPLLLPQTQGS